METFQWRSYVVFPVDQPWLWDFQVLLETAIFGWVGCRDICTVSAANDWKSVGTVSGLHVEQGNKADKLFSRWTTKKGRLQVVPLSHSPSCVTRKKTARKKLTALNFARPFFFTLNLRSHLTDQAKEALLVVWDKNNNHKNSSTRRKRLILMKRDLRLSCSIL